MQHNYRRIILFSAPDSFISASKVAADRIEAQVAEIGELIIAKPIQTRAGDIAYHFVLKDPSAHPVFKEGEVIGLFADKQSGRVLDKLTRENSPDALLRGIVTRSAYIEAKKMPAHSKLPLVFVGNLQLSISCLTSLYF